jgi:hypothetical protein
MAATVKTIVRLLMVACSLGMIYLLLANAKITKPQAELRGASGAGQDASAAASLTADQALDLALERKQRETIKRGYQFMGEHSAAVVMLVRDKKKQLEKSIPYVESTVKWFKNYKVLVLEEDSTDGTKDVLAAWAKRNPRVDAQMREDGSKAANHDGGLSAARFERLASLRNRYLTELNTNKAYKDFEYMIVIDSDLELGWDVDGIAHSFGLLTFNPGMRKGFTHNEVSQAVGKSVNRPVRHVRAHARTRSLTRSLTHHSSTHLLAQSSQSRTPRLTLLPISCAAGNGAAVHHLSAAR